MTDKPYTTIRRAVTAALAGALLTLSATAAATVPLGEVEKRAPALQPGDTLWVAGGEYRDLIVRIEGKGTEKRPVVVAAAKGETVRITGKSSVKIAGEWVVVSGFTFTDGYPGDGTAAVEFRSGGKAADNCRLTQCVIDNFNPASRETRDSYVCLYGRGNRVDHCSLLGKLNSGVTLVVWLNQERDRQNFHRVDHNYFGHRPIYGSNGAETIRVGTSVQSMDSSNTIIEDNYFERCNGEVEVISIKSCDNIVRRNTFFECQGVVALRHGQRNTVEGNLFIGNGVRNTGGVRIVDAGHKVRGNVFSTLGGERFFAALAVMNAVPNSLPNRYVQVTDVDIEGNIFSDCHQILFGAGADNERTLAPQDIRFKNNVIANPALSKPFEALSSTAGIAFSGNTADLAPGAPAVPGFASGKLVQAEAQGARVSVLKGYKLPVTASREECGASRPAVVAVATPPSKTIQVEPGQDNLLAALKKAAPGDVIELSAAGDYPVSSTLAIDRRLVIRAAEGLAKRPVVRYNGSKTANIVTIADGGELTVSGIAFNGMAEPGKATPSSGIATAAVMIRPYLLTVEGCEFFDFPEGSTIPIRGLKGTFSEKIVIRNSLFRAISADAINFAGEKDDMGVYNVEELVVENCAFNRILGLAINVYRGGSDESTGGPIVFIRSCTFEDVCNKERGSVLRLIGGQLMEIRDCNFSNSGRGGASVRLDETVFEKITIENCNFFNSGRIFSTTNKVTRDEMLSVEPRYVDAAAFDYRSVPGSELYDKKIGVR